MGYAKPVRLQTAPTGPGENIELPNYFLESHENRPTEVSCGLGDPTPTQDYVSV